MVDAEGTTLLIKIGGSTLGASDTSLADVAALARTARCPVLVHGGGPEVTSWMAKLGIRAEFVGGLRVTDGPGLDVAIAVLAGLINKRLVAKLLAEGSKAVGLSGADGALLRGTVTDAALGSVAGRVDVDPAPVQTLLRAGYTPVIAPLAIEADASHRLLNVNADTAAGALAVALGAAHLIFLTDVDGILDSQGRLLKRVPKAGAEGLINSGVVRGGMIPKLRACLQACEAGIAAHIINGTRPRALLDCVDGASTGTTVV